MHASQVEVLIAGTGGQGAVFAGTMLARAARAHYHRDAVAVNYGPEARGSASSAEVILADEEIVFPRVQRAGSLLLMSRVAWEAELTVKLAPEALILYNPASAPPQEELERFRALPVQTEAAMAARLNVLFLGAWARATGLLELESLLAVCEEEANRAALRAGYQNAPGA